MNQSARQQFYIYEFSKKFDNIECKEGIWVSGGFELEKTQAFFRSNYGNGNISEIPAEIRQSVAEGHFEIPNACTTNQLTNEDFLMRVKRREIDIAHPQLQDIALIARELDNYYSVLAVATRQMDNTWRSKMVGYRYFWLKTSELNTERPDLVDGIATLLKWWEQNQKPCFDMNPESYENSPNRNQPNLSKQVIYKNVTRSNYKPVPQIYQSNRPCLFDSTLAFDYWKLHAQALHIANLKPAWAWNVRKLTKPETFTVVYCADRTAYEQFFSPDLIPRAALPPKGQSGATSRSQNQSHNYDNSFNESLATPPKSTSSSSPPDPSTLRNYVEDVAKTTESPSFRLLIECYQKYSPERYIDLWGGSFNQHTLEKPKRFPVDLNYIMLMTVLVFKVLQDMPGNSESNKLELSKQEKNDGIQYLDDLSAAIRKYEITHKEPVSKLKKNIANLRKTLSGEDPSEGNGNFLDILFKSLRNIGDNNYYRLPIGLFIVLVFFSFIPLEINPIKPIIKKIAGVAPPPKTEFEQDRKKEYKLQELEAAKEFITKVSITKECKNDASMAGQEKCKIYVQTKNKLPDWPGLPDPPDGSKERMLSKNRNQNNPSDLVIFLAQSLTLLEGETVDNSGEFDDSLEKAVKKFQKNKCQQNPDGQVGENTWSCLSNYVQKVQIIAILDYEINSLRQSKTKSEIEEHIEQCKSQQLLPQDFVECVSTGS